MKNKKAILASLLLAVGMCSPNNLSTIIGDISDSEVDRLINVLNQENVEPAYRVTAVTGPAGKDKSFEDVIDEIVNDYIDVETLDS